MSFLIGAVVGFVLGVVAMFVLKTIIFREYHEMATGTITLGNIVCTDNDTKVSIPFTTIGTPVEIRCSTYDSSATQPIFGDTLTVGTTSPIEIEYDPLSDQDRVVVYAAFAGAPADGAIPCAGSGSGSGSTESARNSSVLP